ncbi:MAG: response regulator [Gaiellaceae bacterium]
MPEVAVLLVEDDAIVRAWVRLALAESEFRIAGEASTAGEALELAGRRAPALLLVDHNLPDGTGTELVRALRERGSPVPAVLMTAGATGGLNEAAREAGVEGTVVKSGRGDELLTALRTCSKAAGRSTHAIRSARPGKRRSRRASARCSAWWPPGGRTPKWRRSSASARRR